MKALFVCSQNIHRSRTAEELFKDRFETKSAGLLNLNPVTKKQIEWADIVFVMEDWQRKEISIRFPELYMKKRIRCLDIPDMYSYMQPELVEILQKKMREFLD